MGRFHGLNPLNDLRVALHVAGNPERPPPPPPVLVLSVHHAPEDALLVGLSAGVGLVPYVVVVPRSPVKETCTRPSGPAWNSAQSSQATSTGGTGVGSRGGGVMSHDGAGNSFTSTVTEAVALRLSKAAVTVPDPFATAVTVPFASTVNTWGASDDQMTVPLKAAPNWSVMLAVKVAVSPIIASVTESGEMVISAARDDSLTLTEAVALRLPCVATTMPDPFPTPVTVPFASTVNTWGASDDQMTVPLKAAPKLVGDARGESGRLADHRERDRIGRNGYLRRPGWFGSEFHRPMVATAAAAQHG